MIDEVFSFFESRYRKFDVRFERENSLVVEFKNGKLEKLYNTSSAGYAVRVVSDGFISFVSLAGQKPKLSEIKFNLRSKLAKKIDLLPVKPKNDEVIIRAKRPLSDTDIETKLNFLREIDKIFESNNVTSRSIYYEERIVEKHIMTSEGINIRFVIPYAYVRVMASHTHNGRMASIRRAWGIIGGWELIDTEDIRNVFNDAANKVKNLAQAKSVKPGKYNVIVDGDLNHLLAHEAFGHASEADSLRERTILKGKIGKRVGNSIVNIVDHKKFELDGVKGFGWLPYDDEGIGGEKTYLVREGIFQGFMTNRETAYEFGFSLTGNGRAQNWMNPVVVRMTNTYIEPARDDLAMSNEELIRELKNGLLLKFGRGGQVNPIAGVFTFGVQEVYRVENGEIKELLASTSISGNILVVLRNIIAVGREYERPEISAGFCGKAGQLVPVGVAGVRILVKNMHVGG